VTQYQNCCHEEYHQGHIVPDKYIIGATAIKEDKVNAAAMTCDLRCERSVEEEFLAHVMGEFKCERCKWKQTDTC
jgi:hypothetical protein